MPSNVKLVHGWGVQFVGGESVYVDGGGPLKLTIISLSTSRVKRTAGKMVEVGRCCLATVRGELPKTG